MEGILQGLHAVDGVLGSVVVDGGGELLGFKAHAVYDYPLLQQLGKRIVTAIDSVQLLHEEWDLLTASFADGKLLIKNLKVAESASRRSVVLGVIAGNQLNPSFAGVAIRVAAGKIKAELESGRVTGPVGPPTSGQSSLGVGVPSNSQAWSAGQVSAPVVASNGQSWSGLGSSRVSASSPAVSDPESAAFLTMCSKALAHSVGPMAKVFVKEAIRKLFGEQAFTLAHADALINEIATHIEDPAEAAAFKKAMKARR